MNISEEIAKLLQKIADETGVRVDSIQPEWISEGPIGHRQQHRLFHVKVESTW